MPKQFVEIEYANFVLQSMMIEAQKGLKDKQAVDILKATATMIASAISNMDCVTVDADVDQPLAPEGSSKLKKHGRKEPYTERGIRRVPCSRCGRVPSYGTWQACADGNIYRPLCIYCDVELNQLVLRFMGFPEPEVQAKIQAYIKEIADDE